MMIIQVMTSYIFRSNVYWILLCTFFASNYVTTMAYALDSQAQQTLLIEANQAFRQGIETAQSNPDRAKELFLKAALRFESLVNQGGIKNGRLYYNIGNCYFRMDRLGEAILNYRRAQLLIPQDANLKQNLSFARSRTLDKISEQHQGKALKTILFWHYDFSIKTRFTVFLIFFVAFWGLAMVRIFSKQIAPYWLLLFCSGVFLLFFASVTVETLLNKSNVAGIILSDEVIAKKGDGESYESAFKEPLHAGTEFIVREQRMGWLFVMLNDGRECWLPEKAVALL